MLVADFAGFEFFDLFTSTSTIQQLWFNSLFLCGLTLIEPFYVAAGFTLYLNRRTWLEGWDMEIGFRRLAQRLAQHGIISVITVTVVCLSLLALPPAIATPQTTAPKASPECQTLQDQQTRLEHAPSHVKRTLAKVLREDPFPHCIARQRWFLEMESEKPQNQLTGTWGDVFAKGIEISLWAAVVLFIAVIAWRLLKNTYPPTTTGRAIPLKASSSVLQGLNKPHTNLSVTTTDDAWTLWTAGRQRDALSLIYRGALLALMKQQGVPFNKAATEDECLQMASKYLSSNHEAVQFLKHLTCLWSALAYGHRLPADGEVRQLCEQWSKHFQATL
jgi:hypothetical protein